MCVLVNMFATMRCNFCFVTKQGLLVHDAPAAQKPTAHSEYEHSSIPATLAKIFGTGLMTRRGAWASTFEHAWSLAEPRKDCPEILPPIPTVWLPGYIQAPSPDGKIDAYTGFNFTRLGVRVPTVMVSPWIPKVRARH